MLSRNIFVGIVTLVGGWLVVAGGSKIADHLDARHSLSGNLIFVAICIAFAGSIYLIARMVDRRRELSGREPPRSPEEY